VRLTELTVVLSKSWGAELDRVFGPVRQRIGSTISRLKKLAVAWRPLYQTLTPVPKRHLGYFTISVLQELRDRVDERRMDGAEEDD
jgi:hypothetical protein